MPEWWWENPVVVLVDEFQSLIVGLVAVGFSIYLHFHDRRE